jgi:hypothetical protein
MIPGRYRAPICHRFVHARTPADGADAGLFQLAGLERQAEQADTRPPKKRRTDMPAAAAAATAQDVGDTPNTE